MNERMDRRPNNENERHVKHCANCSTKMPIAHIAWYTANPVGFWPVHQSERVAAKCTSVMYIIKLIVFSSFSHSDQLACTMWLCVCVFVCVCDCVCIYVSFSGFQLFGVFVVFFIRSILSCFISFHQHNFQAFRSVCAFWGFYMHFARRFTAGKKCQSHRKKKHEEPAKSIEQKSGM